MRNKESETKLEMKQFPMQTPAEVKESTVVTRNKMALFDINGFYCIPNSLIDVNVVEEQNKTYSVLLVKNRIADIEIVDCGERSVVHYECIKQSNFPTHDSAVTWIKSLFNLVVACH